MDALVGAGTGGTITGCARLLKQHNPLRRSGMSQRAVLCCLDNCRESIASRASVGSVPAVERDLIDEVMAITTTRQDVGRRLARSEGLLCGISSGAAVAAALQLAQRSSLANERVVVMLASYGERYLSTPMFSSGALPPARRDAQL